MKVVEIAEHSEKILHSINALLPQLSTSAAPLTEGALREIIGSPSCHLLMAKEDDQYIGSLTLVVFPIPTGKRAWIEDVVVSEGTRGEGIGQLMSERAVEMADSLGAKTVDLTSKPSRTAANAIHRKTGFVERSTNIYRFANTWRYAVNTTSPLALQCKITPTCVSKCTDLTIVHCWMTSECINLLNTRYRTLATSKNQKND